MLSDIKIGQYFPGTSIIHRLDARFKLIALLILLMGLFIFDSYGSYVIWTCLIFLLMMLSTIPLKMYVKALKPIMWIIIFTFFIHLLSGQGQVIFHYGIITITQEGLSKGIFISLRLLLLMFSSTLLTFTTPPLILSDAMEDLMAPLKRFGVPSHEIAMMMTIALRFIPTLLEETDKIIKAQKSRGADFTTGGIKKRIMAVMPILIPLFMGAFRRADELALAMEARCYHGGVGRTRLKKLSLKKVDYYAMVIFGFILIAIGVANYYAGGQ